MNRIDFEAELGAPYVPTAETCNILDVSTPDSMEYEIHIAARKVEQKIGSFTDYVCERLNYSKEELCQALSAEQVDAVALAIYNIEEKNQAIVIGDQTGIGKGRVAAAMIRYGCKLKKTPVFLSEKPNLFSDLYRDLVDIGSDDLVPFIVNARASKTHIKDQYGNIVFKAPEKGEQDSILHSQSLPGNYDFIVATYSQFNQPIKKPIKPMFLMKYAQDNILVLDEAHNAAGTSQTGEFMRDVLGASKGVTYLSATFAKRPDNMPLYAMKTALSEANMSNEKMIEAIQNGGVALQEIISSQLVSEAQMLRRERTYEGIEVNYKTLTEFSRKHREISDKITYLVRKIIRFQEDFINDAVKQMDKIAAAEGKEIEQRKGTKKAGVDNTPYFSKVFNVINQLLFSIKSEEVANHAIKRLKEGKKPVIAFSSTMGAFLEDMGEVGDHIDADFSNVLMNGLQSVLKYTTVTPDGDRIHEMFDIAELGEDAVEEYNNILNEINRTTAGISISPIDNIIQTIENAGYSVAEVTGRKVKINFSERDGKISTVGIIDRRPKLPVNDAFRKFNDNEYDVLLINQSGSTGASAHAKPTQKVPADQVRQRVIIVLQAELDINREIQKRGRINRTGQIVKPIYDYISSDIPAENRLMMMLKRKLKSLDANTTSNQKSGDDILKSEDFLNKYGDKIVTEYLIENPDLVDQLDDPLNFGDKKEDIGVLPGAASKVSGRIAVLSTKEQQKFYDEIISRYQDFVKYLVEKGDYDLEMEAMDLQAKTLDKKVMIAGKGGNTSFGKDTYLEKCEVNNLKKPFTKEELESELYKSLNGKDAKEIQTELREKHKQYFISRYQKEKLESEQKFKALANNITNEKKYKKLESDKERKHYLETRQLEIEQGSNENLKKIQQRLNSLFAYNDKLFEFFYIGRALKYPSVYLQDAEVKETWAVFLGFNIDERKPNPYAPSAIKARFAIADSKRYMALSLSGDQGSTVQMVKGISSGEEHYTSAIVNDWERLTAENSSDRVIRHIVTGNILQGSSETKGKLIDYTLQGGGTSKGILMPEGWNPGGKRNDDAYVAVPIIKALPYIKSLVQGKTLSTENSVSLSRDYTGYTILAPKTKAFAPIYTDPDILALLTDQENGFTMVSGNMKGNIIWNNLESLLQIFQDKFSFSMKIPRAVFDQYYEGETHESDNISPEEKRAIEKYVDDKEAFETRKKQSKVRSAKKPKDNSTADQLKLKLKLQKAKLNLLKL